MISSKREEDMKREEQENAFKNGQSPETAEKVKKNPNPRANENLTDKKESEAEDEGAGSEITDGEDG